MDRRTKLQFDINVNERLGYRNTLLLRRYAELMPQLPHIVLRLKQWAKVHRWCHGMNSYTVTVMTIAVLQV